MSATISRFSWDVPEPADWHPATRTKLQVSGFADQKRKLKSGAGPRMLRRLRY
jgi:hypothetical protein